MFIASVIAVSICIWAPIAGVCLGMKYVESFWNPVLMAGVILPVLLIIGSCTIYKMIQLRKGGSYVAESVGAGQLVHTGDAVETRRIINVVEEMAIASGMPVPPIHIIPSHTINAFAAGWTSEDAVIAVSAGSLQKLTRDQLQGVVAHEFSHVANGDMRLNIRMTGVVTGISAIGMIGEVVSSDIAPGLFRSRDGRGIIGGIAIFLFGLLLQAVGGIGTFCARLMQSATSRQREFLADASSVDYTRNPDGIAGALRAIAGVGRNYMSRSHARELAHFFFTQAWRTSFATHPPIEERIARIERIPVSQVGVDAIESVPGAARGIPMGAVGFVGAASVAGSIRDHGRATPESITHASALIARLPVGLRDALQDPFGAQSCVLATILSHEDAIRSKQLKMIEARFGSGMDGETQRMSAFTDALDGQLRLLVLDLAVPALARLDREEAVRFIEIIDQCMHADGRIDRFEWLLGRIVRRRIMARITCDVRREGRQPLQALSLGISTILMAVARRGARTEQAATAAFEQGAGTLRADCGVLAPPERVSIEDLDEAFDQVSQGSGSARVAILEACVATAEHDGKIRIGEYEMIRAAADALGLGMPPLMVDA